MILVAGLLGLPAVDELRQVQVIADEVGATLMVDMAHFAGLVAGKVFTGDEDRCPMPTSYHHRAQVAAGARGPAWSSAQPEYAELDQSAVCPGRWAAR